MNIISRVIISNFFNVGYPIVVIFLIKQTNGAIVCVGYISVFIRIFYGKISIVRIRKELHLGDKLVSALEAEAKRQDRGLKNYLENLAIEEAKKLEVPAKEYTDMMDDLLAKFDENEIECSTMEEVMEKNGI